MLQISTVTLTQDGFPKSSKTDIDGYNVKDCYTTEKDKAREGALHNGMYVPLVVGNSGGCLFVRRRCAVVLFVALAADFSCEFARS